MRFAKYLGKSFLFYTTLGLGVGLGSASGALLAIRADEILKKKREDDALAKQGEADEPKND